MSALAINPELEQQGVYSDIGWAIRSQLDAYGEAENLVRARWIDDELNNVFIDGRSAHSILVRVFVHVQSHFTSEIMKIKGI